MAGVSLPDAEPRVFAARESRAYWSPEASGLMGLDKSLSD